MKKLIASIAAIGFMASSALAIDGTVVKVILNTSTGLVKVGIDDGSATYAKNVDVSTDLGKAIYATALTAKTTQKPVTAFHDGTNWNYIEINE